MTDLLIFLLIILFFCLICQELYRRYFLREGMDSYQNYDPNLEVNVNKNTANIEYLKGQVDSLSQTTTGLNTTVTNLTSQVQTLQDQVQNMNNAQQAYLQPEVANAEPDEEEEETPLVPQETIS